MKNFNKKLSLLCQVEHNGHIEEKIKFNFTSLWFLMAPLFENILTVLQRWQHHYFKHLKVDGDGLEDEEEDVDKDDNNDMSEISLHVIWSIWAIYSK